MAVPFVRLGLFAADKVVDAHFHKINDDVFTPGHRKRGLKRLATPRKYNKYHSSSQSRDLALASGAGVGAASGAGADTGSSNPDHGYDGGSDSTSSESEPEHGPHPHPDPHSYSRSRRSRARSRGRRHSDAYEPRRARSVDRYYHPSYDYTRDPLYGPAPLTAPYVADGQVWDPRVQEQNFGREDERPRVYEPPRWGDEWSSRGGAREVRERRDRPGLKKRSSSVGDLRDRRGRGETDEKRGGKGSGKPEGRGITGRLGEWKEKEGTLSLIAAGVMAGSAVLLHM